MGIQVDMTWTSMSGRPRATLHGVLCATSECKVMCVLETRLRAIPASRVMCDLNAQVAHEGSSYVECARTGVVLTSLDVMSSAGLNTW